MSAKSLIIIMLVTILLGLSTATLADNSNTQLGKLEQIREKIRNIHLSLGSSRQDQDRSQQRLRESEIMIGTISKRLFALRTQLQKQESKLNKLRSEKNKENRDLSHLQSLLVQQIKSSYAISQQGYLKIILNQQNPATVGRSIAYYDYLNRERSSQINKIKGKLTSLAILEKEIEKESIRLGSLYEDKKIEMTSLQDQKLKRNRILAKINKDIRNKTRELDLLKQDEQRLVSLIEQLKGNTLNVPERSGASIPFGQLRGNLAWPVDGKIKAEYGTSRHSTGLKWQGVMLQAEEGDEIKAVYQGRIAFADWFRGLGLLLIIDHGDGFMTLYGHNQSLYKSEGEWVEQGEVIATVGNSGGLEQSGLYFEIRSNGKPKNPVHWCRK